MIDCVNPYLLKNQNVFVRCGKCLLCRLHKRSEWTLRIQLEASCWQDNSFITLTYDDAHCPRELNLRDFQLYMKRLRKVYKKSIRYFMAGEYGDTYHRPHFHQILFGFSYKDKELVANSWQNGFVDVSPLTPDRANYTCGYVQKKFDYASQIDYYRLFPNTTIEEREFIARERGNLDDIVERQPFSTSSRRPALGLTWYNKNKFWLKDANFIAYCGRRYPIPRYFKELLFEEFPEYKERLVKSMEELHQSQIDKYKDRVRYDVLDIEFNNYYLSVLKQRQNDLIKKNALYLQKKKNRRLLNESKVL